MVKAMKTEKNVETKPKRLSGVVVSDKMSKTIVVEVNRYVKHPKYKKYFKISKKYKAHDEKGERRVGEKVTIVECRPISKDKHFNVIDLIPRT